MIFRTSMINSVDNLFKYSNFLFKNLSEPNRIKYMHRSIYLNKSSLQPLYKGYTVSLSLFFSLALSLTCPIDAQSPRKNMTFFQHTIRLIYKSILIAVC